MKITLAWVKKKLWYPNIHFILSPYFLLSFDWSLSCTLQLIDLIMVSATGSANNPGMFFPENCGFAGKEETSGWKISNATGCFLVQIHPSHFAQDLRLQLKNVLFLHLIHIRWPCKHYNFQTCLRDNLMPRMLQMAFQSFQISKFSGGACPQTSLVHTVGCSPLTSCLLQILLKPLHLRVWKIGMCLGELAGLCLQYNFKLLQAMHKNVVFLTCRKKLELHFQIRKVEMNYLVVKILIALKIR